MLHRAVGRSAFLLTLAHLALMWQDYGLTDHLSTRPNCFGALARPCPPAQARRRGRECAPPRACTCMRARPRARVRARP